MKLTKIVVGLTSQKSVCEEAVVFPEHIGMLYAIDSSYELYAELNSKYKKYRNIKLFNYTISNNRSQGKTLKEFVEENNITSIDKILIDTEGYELDILDSLGDSISILKEGQIMCHPLDSNSSFENQATYTACSEYLSNKGFYINSLFKTKDNEWCIYFDREKHEQET